MPHTLRLIQTSDLHYCAKTLTESDRCFSAAVDHAINSGAQAFLVAGDATDHALDLHSPAVMRLAKQIRRLADHCPVLMLQGTYSHEPLGTLNVMRLLGGRYEVFVADRVCQVSLDSQGGWTQSAGWAFEELPPDCVALFSCLPTVNKGALASVVGAGQVAEAVGESVSAVLAGFAPMNEIARRNGIPTIGVSHGTVHGCRTEHDVPMAGLDHEFTSGSLFSAAATAFCLGHIHKHQVWEQPGQTIAYAGSIGRFHHGEQGDKGFIEWSVGASQHDWQFVHTPARRTIDVRCTGLPNTQELARMAAEGAFDGAHVRLIWDAQADEAATVDRAELQRILGGADSVKMDCRIVSSVVARSPGISRIASVADQLKAWALLGNNDPAPLLRNLEALQQGTPKEIAEAIFTTAGVMASSASLSAPVSTPATGQAAGAAPQTSKPARADSPQEQTTDDGQVALF